MGGLILPTIDGLPIILLIPIMVMFHSLKR